MKKYRYSPKRIQAMIDVIDAMKIALKSHTPHNRKSAWKGLTSEKGNKLMNKFFYNLNLPTSRFRTLKTESFKEFLDRKDN